MSTNAIAEAVYAQCDANGNQYVLLGDTVDNHKDSYMAVVWDNQEFIIDGKKIVKHST